MLHTMASLINCEHGRDHIIYLAMPCIFTNGAVHNMGAYHITVRNTALMSFFCTMHRYLNPQMKKDSIFMNVILPGCHATWKKGQ